MNKTLVGILVTCVGASISEVANYLLMKQEIKREVKEQLEEKDRPA